MAKKKKTGSGKEIRKAPRLSSFIDEQIKDIGRNDGNLLITFYNGYQIRIEIEEAPIFVEEII